MLNLLAMEILRPDVNWNDSERVSVLYGPLPNQNLNPDAWNAKLQFWEQTIEKWLRREGRSTLSVDVIEREFSFNGRKPHCLTDVVKHLMAKKILVKYADIKSKFVQAAVSSASWSNWTYNVLKSGVTGLFQIAVGSQGTFGEQEEFVQTKLLEENSRIFFENMKSNPNCFKLNKCLCLKLNFVDEIKKISSTEKDLMLAFLKFNACCDFETLADGQTFVKIVEKKQAGSSALFTPQVWLLQLSHMLFQTNYTTFWKLFRIYSFDKHPFLKIFS